MFKRIMVSRVFYHVATLVLLGWNLPALAMTLEGDEASSYSHYCPDDSRAVWIETFDHEPLASYTRLICLHEPTQSITDWWIAPEDAVIPYHELPDFPEPPPRVLHESLEHYLYDPDHVINTDPTAAVMLLLYFSIDYPELPPLPYNYTSSGSFSVGEDGLVESSSEYWVEGERVAEATYLAYESQAREAERAQRAEVDRLIHQSAQLKLYELTNLVDWHDWLDVDAVNTHQADNACWLYKDTLLTSLTREQIDQLVNRAESLLSLEAHGRIELDDAVDADTVVQSNTNTPANVAGGDYFFDGVAGSLAEECDNYPNRELESVDSDGVTQSEVGLNQSGIPAGEEFSISPNSSSVMADEVQSVRLEEGNRSTGFFNVWMLLVLVLTLGGRRVMLG